MNNLKQLPWRNIWRMAAFDVIAPLAAIAGVVMVGYVLTWPWWWVMTCTALVLLIVEGVAVNFWLLRRDSVTVGTDNEHPLLRLVVVVLCTAALAAAVTLEHTRWTVPDRELNADSEQVVKVAAEMSQAAASVDPSEPSASIDKAAALMAPDRVEAFRDGIGRTATDLAYRNIAVRAEPLNAGVEAIGPAAARVVVVLRSTQSVMGEQLKQTIVPVRITLTKRDDKWMVVEMAPIHLR